MNEMHFCPSVAVDYMSMADSAALLERQGEWADAARAWRFAMLVATKGENRAWADARQERCQFRVEQPNPALERCPKPAKATTML